MSPTGALPAVPAQSVATLARLAKSLGGRLPPAGARIGLLGGSFNPAHQGHREISLAALRRLGLDEVWWLVSPQNPLKGSTDMASAAQRLARARAVAGHPRIRPTGIESDLGTRYTADSLRALRRRFPRVRFVWLMGADNLVQVPRWQNWQEIFHLVAIAVFDRPSYSLRAWSGKAAQRFRGRQVPPARAAVLAGMNPPAWTFIRNRLNDLSATQIRASGRATGPDESNGRRRS